MSGALANVTPQQLAQMPAGSPPAGLTSNLENPDSEGYVLITVGGVAMVVMFLFLGMRLFVKLKVQRKSSADDWTTLVAAIGTCLYYAICVFGVTRAKFATHLWDISIAHTMSDDFLIFSFFANWPTALVWAFAKTSFFLMYLDLFKPLRWLRLGVYCGLFLNWGFYIAVIIASIYFNAPSPGQTWLEGAQNPRYTKSFNMTMPIAAGSLFLDCYILVLPISVVWHLQLSMRRRLGVMAIFATGFLACVASSMSIAFKHKLNEHLDDYTYWTYPVLLLALVEMCVGISCSCMPSTAAFWRYLRGKGTSWTTWGSSLLTPFRSLFGSGNQSTFSRDPSGKWKKDSNQIHKTSYINIEVETASTRNLTQEHEMVDLVDQTAATV